MLKKDDAKQRSFKSSLRQSRRKTFPKFTRRQTKFQDSASEAGLERRVSYPQAKNGVKGEQRKGGLNNHSVSMPIQADYCERYLYNIDDMQEIHLTLERDTKL